MKKQKGEYPIMFQTAVIQRFLKGREFEDFYDQYKAAKLRDARGNYVPMEADIAKFFEHAVGKKPRAACVKELGISVTAFVNHCAVIGAMVAAGEIKVPKKTK